MWWKCEKAFGCVGWRACLFHVFLFVLCSAAFQMGTPCLSQSTMTFCFLKFVFCKCASSRDISDSPSPQVCDYRDFRRSLRVTNLVIKWEGSRLPRPQLDPVQVFTSSLNPMCAESGSNSTSSLVFQEVQLSALACIISLAFILSVFLQRFVR